MSKAPATSIGGFDHVKQALQASLVQFFEELNESYDKLEDSKIWNISLDEYLFDRVCQSSLTRSTNCSQSIEVNFGGTTRLTVRSIRKQINFMTTIIKFTP